MASYQEQIAQWRVQREQQKVADRCNQIRQEYAQVQRERDQAIANNDLETAEFRDEDCKQLEDEWSQYNPPQQQVHPLWQNWIREHSAFIEREGDRGVAAVTGALAYMQRPRNERSGSNDPRYRGMGMRPEQIFTPQGLDKLEDLLELHGQQFFNVRFDKSERGLNANQARDISGVDTKTYNAAYHALKREGRIK